MKYSQEIVINLPVDKVIELFDNSDNLSKWQPDLISFKHLSGDAGQPGAVSQLIYKMGNRKIEMTETIMKRNLPEEFSGTYETKGVKNLNVNKFRPMGEGQTLWQVDTTFMFKGFMAIFSLFMRGAFKKQTMKFMKQFKEYAESA